MIEIISDIAKRAGKIILSASDEKNTTTKSSRHDLVTIYDVKVQDYIFGELRKKYPDVMLVGEEKSEQNEIISKKCFIVDPIDGTANFVRDMRHSCVSIAYYENDCAVAGVIYNPYRDELFTAQRGNGAYLNGKGIHASNTEPENALVSFGTSPYYPELYDKTFRISKELTERCMDLRRLGSAALDLCDLAAGRVDMYFELRLSPWDYAAGRLIAEEAGAIVTDDEDNSLSPLGKSAVIGGNKLCHEFLLDIVQSI